MYFIVLIYCICEFQAADSVYQSSRNGHNVPQLVSDENKPVTFYNWREHLQQFFKPLKNISRYHHFCVSSEFPGIVEVKERSTGPTQTFTLLKPQCVHPSASEHPSLMEPKGMDITRQWYLYDNIREFCTTEEAKDAVCPKPDRPKPKHDFVSKENVSPSKLHAKRKQSLLS